ncbi:hypothetical protein CALCODRAFT_491551 [Calocera cornea HHB12733]|uniref:Pinin/SDK/MemA protein domain-containing protein n=1 Tax=Calocera cornea HHB12733 TaxID=1353952 RepID=A0A165IYZ0_9BASI|nr:hypothetical protein CALCODRAFT_491551 [Calocera cornea HHB12733]
MAEVQQDAIPHVPDRPRSEEPGQGESTHQQSASPQQVIAAPSRKRPRLDLTAEPRKRGKTMFGILVGTLNKAKDEDARRSKSEAARRRMSLETKLQSKLALEQDEMRRQGEIKKTRSLASRKEDDIVIQDSVLRLSHRIKPLLSHFLTTSDMIALPPAADPLASIPLSLAPPAATHTVLYYLPAILLPEQEVFLRDRQISMAKLVDSEQRAWRDERKQGMDEVELLRRRAEEIASSETVTDEVDSGSVPAGQEEAVPSTFPEPPADAVPSATKVEADDAEEEVLEY